MRRIALAGLLLLPITAQAQQAPTVPQEVVVLLTHTESAIARLFGENAALESRLATAMEWLKSAQDEAKKAAAEAASLKGGKAPQ